MGPGQGLSAKCEVPELQASSNPFGCGSRSMTHLWPVIWIEAGGGTASQTRPVTCKMPCSASRNRISFCMYRLLPPARLGAVGTFVGHDSLLSWPTATCHGSDPIPTHRPS